jgi:hypothetical protein
MVGTLLAVVLATGPAVKKTPKIAILNVETKAGFDKGRTDVFLEFLQNELRARGNTVISRSDIEAIVGFEQTRQTLGCSSSACLAEIGGALGVDELMTGQLAKLDPYITVTLKRIDPKNGMVIKQVAKKLDTKPESTLVDAVPALVGELFGTSSISATTTAPTTVGKDQLIARFVSENGADYDVRVVQHGTEVACPARVAPTAPCEVIVSSGKSELVVGNDGHTKHMKYTYPRSGAVVHRLSLKREWPFWAGLGGVLAGTAPLLVGTFYQCRAGTGSWCGPRIALVASGGAVLAAGMSFFIWYWVDGGNRTRHERVTTLGPVTLEGIDLVPLRNGALGAAAFAY